MELSVPLHGRTQLGDDFNEDLTELKFLQSKPACFVVFGKPGSGKTSIAKKLSEIWRCELIHGTDIVQREIDIGSAVGDKMQEMLMKGESLPTEFIIQLLKEKLSSPEVTHYGYVLDGLPSLSEEPDSARLQLEIIKSCQLKPDFIINIRIPDVDLISRKNGMRVDSLTGDTYLKNVWDPPPQVERPKPPTDEEEEDETEEEEEEIEEEKKDLELTKETKQRLVHIPEHQISQVQEFNQLYKDMLLKLVEDYMADHDRQYVIELDGNCSLNTMVEQLMMKLDTYTARRAMVPIRLQSADEEELPDEIDTDELLRTLASYQMPGPRHRWRRSKWGRWCPVALKKGNMIQGKPDLAVGFLDKIYIMSSADAMTEFLKNPRPFLLPPMPVAPCKLAVFGPPLSGKTTVCKILAEKYKAEVIDMHELMRTKVDEAKQIAIDKARKEATEQAIVMVQNKLEHEALDRAEKRRKEVQEAKEAQEQQDEEDRDPEEEPDAKPGPGEDPTDDVTESLVVDTQSAMESEASSIPTVTADHEEVQHMVAEAVIKAEAAEIQLPPGDYIEVLKETMAKMVEKKLQKDKDAPKDGGWILDGFPHNKDQWMAMIDAGIVPDDCIALSDKTPNQEHMRKRYFELNRSDIIEQYRARLIAEKQAELKEVEDDMKRTAQVSETTEETEAAEDSDKDVKSSKSEVVSEVSQPALAKAEEDTLKMTKLLEEISNLETADVGVPPFDSPEFSNFRDIYREYDKEWANLHSTITGSGGNKPIQSDVDETSSQDITNAIVEQIEGAFGYRAWNFTGVDLDEEEEDASGDADLEEEGEDDDEAAKNKKKQFGFSKHFDPVSLKDDFVLWPGDSEIAAKYRERVYFFKSTENRDKFVENPTGYLPMDKPLSPPPPRMLILGALGSGKSLQGRTLAKEMGIFHISFKERLQELILPKTQRKMGWEHDETRLFAKEMSVSVEDAVKKAIETSSAETISDEEEEKFDLTDEEEAVRSNLLDDEPLPEELLEKIILPWWKEEPYKSTGFVLEGFPRTADETQFLIQNGLFPDAAILLMIDDTDVVKRLLPDRMSLWKRRKVIRDEKKFRIKEKKKEIRNEKIEARRAELLNEQKERRAAQADEEEEEEEEDIEEILLNEFEEEEEAEEEEEELEQDASDRMKTEFGEHFDEDVNKLQSVQEQLEESSIPRIEIQASRKSSIVKYLIHQKIKSLVKYRTSMFERAYPVSEEMARKLLLTGYKHPSSYARWDPVKLYDGEVIQPIQDATFYPIVYNQYVYYLSSLECRDRFIENPLEFAFNQPIAKPVVPIQVAVVGPPKSGKTTLCNRFTQEFGTVRVSVGSSVRKILETQPESNLAIQILSFLYQGELLPDELAVEALAITLLDTTCTTRGYALDGFPCTANQLVLMNNRGILPVKIIQLQIDEREILHRSMMEDFSMEESEYPLHKSDDILMVKQAAHLQDIDFIRNYFETQHKNWLTFNAKISKWKLWKNVFGVTKTSVARVQDYLDCIARGEAANLADLCISPSEFEAHLGAYGHYCPVSLNLRNELVDCSDPSYLRFAVEYRSKYYKTESKENLGLFIANPTEFVPPSANRSLPPSDLLPRRRTKEQVKSLFPMQVDFNGYCPVSYYDGKLRFEAMVEGRTDMAVEYKGKLHFMADEDKVDKFMRSPHIYSGIKLPNKLPPKRDPMPLTGLPMLGYLEQGASTSIIRALTAVGCFKPKYPFSSIQQSSLFYIACHLKAFNPKNPDFIRQKYQKKLKEFEETCGLITYLGNTMTSRLPRSRPVEFDEKMKIFVGLENHRPNRNRVR